MSKGTLEGSQRFDGAYVRLTGGAVAQTPTNQDPRIKPIPLLNQYQRQASTRTQTLHQNEANAKAEPSLGTEIVEGGHQTSTHIERYGLVFFFFNNPFRRVCFPRTREPCRIFKDFQRLQTNFIFLGPTNWCNRL